jgi:hypothetical protein
MNASDRSTEKLFIWTIGVGVALAGVAFAYKIAGFVHVLTSADFRGTFDVGISVYFAVSAGWLCLLAWCFTTGKFQKMERAKYEMLKQEEEYERRGI